MKRKWLILTLILSIFCACQQPQEGTSSAESEAKETDKTADVQVKTIIDDADTVSVKVKMQEHSVLLRLSKEDMKKVQLSARSVKELESWWDSLPNQLQSQIKSKEVEIELVSNIRSSDKNAVKPEVTDTRIENTGATLERIIGESADMTFKVHTTLLEGGNATADNNEQSTEILLIRKVPMKLNQFNSEIYLGEKGITNQNIHSLQYWWSNLPDDLREKIQRRELLVDLSCVALDKGVESHKNARVGEDSEEYMMIAADVLQEMIGYSRVGKKSVPLGQIKTQALIESIGANTPNNVSYLIRVQLRSNKLTNTAVIN